MNIMRTNMLLLNNNIKKEDSEAKTTTVAAEVPSTTEPQAGMKALMFQGMQNLMADPELATKAGMMNEETKDDKSEKPETNVAFHGKFGNAANAIKGKFRHIAGAALIPGLLLAAGAPALTSCEQDPPETTTTVTVTIDLKAMTQMISMMQTTLTQMLAQQKLTYEQFQQYMEQTAAWQQQMTQRMDNLEAILTDMGENIIDVKNGIKENNSYQQLIIGMLQQFMTKDEATALLNRLISEVAAGNKTVAQAMEEIMKQLQLVNKNLDTISSKMDRAYEQRAQVITTLKDIKGDTQAMRAAVEYANTQLETVNQTIIDGNNSVLNAINKMDGDMKAGVSYIAQTVGWSTAQVIGFMNKMGIDIQNTNSWNASKIIAAINYNTKVTKEVKAEIAAFKADFDAGKITAEEYANKILNVLNDIDSKVGTLIEDFDAYAENMQSAADKALKELKFGNVTAIHTNGLLIDVLKNQQKAQAMLDVMNQNIENIDIDMNANMDALAAQLGCSTSQIMNMLGWLGYSQAEISRMNTGAIINAIKGASNKTIYVLGNKLNDIINKIGTGNNTVSQEDIDEIISLLQNINKGVSEISADVKEILAKMDNYAKQGLDAMNKQDSILEKIQGSLNNIGSRVNILINQGKNAEFQRTEMLTAINNIKTQINQLIAQKGSITPQELDAMLDKYTKELIAQLKINPADYSTIEKLLQDIDAKMDYQAQANKILLDILNAVKALDKSSPDYNAKLDKIIDLMKNFKCECNCKKDCDENEKIHEGIIEIIS